MISRPGKQRWFLRLHALERTTEMGLTRADVVRVLDEPEVTYPSLRSGGFTSTRGPLAVGWEADTVYTVLWNGRSSRCEGPDPARGSIR